MKAKSRSRESKKTPLPKNGQAVLKLSQAQVILRMHQARDWKGERLTSIDELAVKFGVSTRTIRRAISRARESLIQNPSAALPDIGPWIIEANNMGTELGWHDQSRSLAGAQLMDFQSELSALHEEFGSGHDLREIRYEGDHGEPAGLAVGLASLLFRIFDLAAELDLPLQEAMVAKSAFNWRRDNASDGDCA